MQNLKASWWRNTDAISRVSNRGCIFQRPSPAYMHWYLSSFRLSPKYRQSKRCLCALLRLCNNMLSDLLCLFGLHLSRLQFAYMVTAFIGARVAPSTCDIATARWAGTSRPSEMKCASSSILSGRSVEWKRKYQIIPAAAPPRLAVTK